MSCIEEKLQSVRMVTTIWLTCNSAFDLSGDGGIHISDIGNEVRQVFFSPKYKQKSK